MIHCVEVDNDGKILNFTLKQEGDDLSGLINIIENPFPPELSNPKWDSENGEWIES